MTNGEEALSNHHTALESNKERSDHDVAMYSPLPTVLIVSLFESTKIVEVVIESELLDCINTEKGVVLESELLHEVMFEAWGITTQWRSAPNHHHRQIIR